MRPEEPAAGEAKEKTSEELAAENAEAEAAFAQGVTNVTGTSPAGGAGEDVDAAKAKADEAAKAKATSEAEAKVKSEEAEKAKAAAAPDEWAGVPPVVRKSIETLGGNLSAQISKIAGHVGSFKQTLDSITATAKAAAEKKGESAPTKVEIEEALADPEKWKQLQDDFPEWMGPVAAELTRLRKDMATFAKTTNEREAARPAAAEPVKQEPIDTSKIKAEAVAEAEERAYVRMKHPDWKQICATPAFAKDWLPNQSAELKAKAASDNADDAIAVFDAYKAHEKKIAEVAAEKLKKEKRLAGAVTVDGSAEPPPQGLSDEAAFELGVKRVRGQAK